MGVLVLFAGCTSYWERSLERADTLAAAGGFVRVTFDAEDYVLTGFHNQGHGADLVVYIQGDGLPYISRNRVSSNPTPHSPLALELAMADPAANVLYIARPCQFSGRSDPDMWRECEVMDWTLGRYSRRVVIIMNKALNQARERFGASRLHLVGHSGGGTMAALLASMRTDVVSLITVAANLDHAAWTTHHDVTPLRYSVNPVEIAPFLRTVPQIHFRGCKDTCVPPQTTASFFRALGHAQCLKVIDVDNVAHGRDWLSVWRNELQIRNEIPCFPAPETKESACFHPTSQLYNR